jgi:hypothetical protein
MFKLAIRRYPWKFGSRGMSSKRKKDSKSLFTHLKPFLKFSRPEYKLVGCSLGLLLISSSVTMSVPFSMGAIIDVVVGDEYNESNNQQPSSESKSILAKTSNPILKELLLKTGSMVGLFSVLGAVFVGKFDRLYNSWWYCKCWTTNFNDKGIRKGH